MKVVLLLTLILWSGTVTAQEIGSHSVRTDASGNLLPWYSDDPATSYDYCIRRIWNFWNTMERCCGGVPPYLVYRTFDDRSDHVGIGGDQIAMALSSWKKLYQYSGDSDVVGNMKLIANSYLLHSLSDSSALWPFLPYPCNLSEQPFYDGDLIAGLGYTQPDKAGSFAAELVDLFKVTADSSYLRAAIHIGRTLVQRVRPGDSAHSPWPFRVHATSGDVHDAYTTNWTRTIELFQDLATFDSSNKSSYLSADSLVVDWLLQYPLRTNNWGPFYEDITGWSNTQINATSFARFLLTHPEWDPNWKTDARSILDWTIRTFSDSEWQQFHIYPIAEQTVYMIPGNSHTSDYASAELLYAERTGDTSRVPQTIRQLNWATYWVDSSGANRYPRDAIWLTDGYGDYVRHYLNAMASDPELAPVDHPHLLRSSSILSSVSLPDPSTFSYSTFDQASTEWVRSATIPESVINGSQPLSQVAWPSNGSMIEDGWAWKALAIGGVTIIHKSHGRSAQVTFDALSLKPAATLVPYISVLSGGQIAIHEISRTAYFEIYNETGVRLLKREILPSLREQIISLPAGFNFVRLYTGEWNIVQKIVRVP
jgi:hypothetical protein